MSTLPISSGITISPDLGDNPFIIPSTGGVLFVDKERAANIGLEEETLSQLTPSADRGPSPDTISKSSAGRNGVTSAEDAAYMDAVDRDDTETSQRMVREAAARTGYYV